MDITQLQAIQDAASDANATIQQVQGPIPQADPLFDLAAAASVALNNLYVAANARVTKAQ